MSEHRLSRSVPQQLRSRVAVPVPPPVSLIPVDVLQDMAREEQRRGFDESFDTDPRTAQMQMNAPVLGTVRADVEVAYFALTQVPLFRDLPPASIDKMSQDAIQLEVPDGELLFREGDEATSFFVVVDGTLELLRHKEGREVALRHTTKGEAFGLFGLFSAQLRAASARAIGDCTILEISSERLQTLLAGDEALHQRLLGFYRERLVEGFMASRLFTDIDSIARARLIGRFQHMEFEAGQALVNPGEVANVLAVVTHGRLVVEDRSRMGQDPRRFEITQGQFLAMTCALSGLPSKLRVVAPEYATISILAHKNLAELMRDYPALRSLPSRLPHYARALDRDVFCGGSSVPGL